MTVDRNKLITIAGLDNYNSRLWNQINNTLDEFAPATAEDYEVDNYVFGIQLTDQDSCPSPEADNGAHVWESDSENHWECSLCGAVYEGEGTPGKP